MAQQLRALGAFAEDLSLALRTHRAAHNHLQLFWLLQVLHTRQHTSRYGGGRFSGQKGLSSPWPLTRLILKHTQREERLTFIAKPACWDSHRPHRIGPEAPLIQCVSETLAIRG